ncbi:MAG: zinc ABC transporter substrate-binding protein [Lachnospiraceae bacterium]|nr:zinc ABC transporter substrate-binding protein [Lachnospiraceae bacterium]
MKRILSIVIAAVLACAGLAGCAGAGSASADNAQAADKIQVVATIFPAYDWAKEVLGEKADNVELTLLLDNGVDLHSYQPTAEDISKIAACDLFIYVGGESDEWVEDVLAQATNKDMKVINMLEALGDAVKDEEIVEGMEHEHHHEDGEDEDHEHEHEDGEDEDHDHDHDDEDADHDHEHEHEDEKDEHVWLSIRNAKTLCAEIALALTDIDKANTDEYLANLNAYEEKLDALDEKYMEATKNASVKTVLFGDRFPFRYLVDDYDLEYFAAFAGCSAETEASFETVVFLAEKVDELSLPAILTIEGDNKKLAETIRDNASNKDLPILELDSLQSASTADAAKGVSYLSAMENNLETLKKAID